MDFFNWRTVYIVTSLAPGWRMEGLELMEKEKARRMWSLSLLLSREDRADTTTEVVLSTFISTHYGLLELSGDHRQQRSSLGIFSGLCVYNNNGLIERPKFSFCHKFLKNHGIWMWNLGIWDMIDVMFPVQFYKIFRNFVNCIKRIFLYLEYLFMRSSSTFTYFRQSRLEEDQN